MFNFFSPQRSWPYDVYLSKQGLESAFGVGGYWVFTRAERTFDVKTMTTTYTTYTTAATATAPT